MIVRGNDEVRERRHRALLRIRQHARPRDFLFQKIRIAADAAHTRLRKGREIERGQRDGKTDDALQRIATGEGSGFGVRHEWSVNPGRFSGKREVLSASISKSLSFRPERRRASGRSVVEKPLTFLRMGEGGG